MQKILRRNIKNIACNYTEAQIKVREATSNDAWGPSAVMLSEIADLTYNVVEFPKIMEMIYRRLNDSGKNWRHVKKALILMEYLAKTGVEKCVKQFKENIYAIQSLREFVYFEDGKDYGRQVREKANQLISFLNDNDRLRSERLKALRAKESFARGPLGISYNDARLSAEARLSHEFESVRPKTIDEEELHIKLALDMSREEAKEESKKRRSDDVRYKLALEESERKQKVEATPSHMLDLLDISLGAASGSSNSAPNLDPWTPLTNRQNTKTCDPWSQPFNAQNDPWQPKASLAAQPAAKPLPYGWVNTNDANTLCTTWPPLPAREPPTTSFTAHNSYQTVQNSAPFQDQFDSTNFNNVDDPFREIDRVSNNFTFNSPDHTAVNRTANLPNTDPYASPSSFNPFL